MVTIRLARRGAKKRPFYHIVVANSRDSRDGNYIEKLGFFNPISTPNEERVKLSYERLQHWCSKGAQLSKRVQSLVKQYGTKASEATVNV